MPTKDDVLVARHENAIADTTDVADHPEFASRRTTKTIDGQSVTGWFTEDFTLGELKTLRARERIPSIRPDNVAYNDQFDIPTLDEIIALARDQSAKLGRNIGIYPETKHPTYFQSIGLPLEDRLIDGLRRDAFTASRTTVYIQSFEVANLRRLESMTKVRLIQLLGATGGPADGGQPSYAAMITPAGLKAIAAYAHGIGPDKAMLWADDRATPLVADAHRAGLKVHPWTYRAEEPFLPPSYRGRLGRSGVRAELRAALDQQIDGFFTDFPLDGRQVRDGAP